MTHNKTGTMVVRLALPALIAMAACEPEGATREDAPEKVGRGADPASVATITFTSPIEVEEVVDLAERYELDPRLTYAYATHANDTIGTLVTRAPLGELGDAISLASHVEQVEFLGVGAIVVTISDDGADRIRRDPRVYSLDVVTPEGTGPAARSAHPRAWELLRRAGRTGD